MHAIRNERGAVLAEALLAFLPALFLATLAGLAVYGGLRARLREHEAFFRARAELREGLSLARGARLSTDLSAAPARAPPPHAGGEP